MISWPKPPDRCSPRAIHLRNRLPQDSTCSSMGPALSIAFSLLHDQEMDAVVVPLHPNHPSRRKYINHVRPNGRCYRCPAPPLACMAQLVGRGSHFNLEKGRLASRCVYVKRRGTSRKKSMNILYQIGTATAAFTHRHIQFKQTSSFDYIWTGYSEARFQMSASERK